MNDLAPPSPLAAKALERLRKLAEGNGLTPEDIHLFSSEEKTYTLEGKITLSPLFETQQVRVAGGPRGHNRRIFDNGAAMKDEVARLKRAFESRPSWITEAIAQLKEQRASGWGLDDVRISLPAQSAFFAASELCPSCHGSKALTCQQCGGQGSITCPHCQGNRQEHCPICLGSGTNPSMPGQPCINCQGLRFTPCRYCQGSGHLTCPTCHGRRGTVCTGCNGVGQFTEEIAITCGARTQFRLKAEGLPSGLRRGLDRLGLARLAEGHADIEPLAPVVEDDDAPAPPPLLGASEGVKKEKAVKPEIHYLATMPYADLRMSFAGKRTIVGVFGKKNVLLGVPAFLDRSLESQRENLQKAAKGEANLESVLDARLMKDVLRLQLRGEGQLKALRRLYPLGLSPQAASEILANMRRALNRMTLRSRSLAAILCATLGGGIFAGLFLTGLHNRITQGWALPMAAGFDLAILLIVMTACWFALSAATRFVLQKSFPDFSIPITQKIGKTGYAMLAMLLVMFIAALLLAPTKPEWLQQIVANLH